MRIRISLGMALVAILFGTSAYADSGSDLRIASFGPDAPLCRAKRAATVTATILNPGDSPVNARAILVPPKGIRILGSTSPIKMRLADDDQKKATWKIFSDSPGERRLQVVVAAGDRRVTASVVLRFLPYVPIRKLSYIPEPKPLKTPILIGALACPLWEADKYTMWDNILKHPERTPALGFYAQENPQVADWETKWAVEHGVSFFVYCWYRASQGGPVKQNFGSAIHQGLFKSKFARKMKFAIMWENQNRGTAGVSDEKDLLTNLLPFWIKNYFKNPSYLKVDGKPLLYVYRPEFLPDDLGGVEKAAEAVAKMRQACVKAGFAGLTILGEYRGSDPEQFKSLKRIGVDDTFAYCWYVPNNPTPAQAIAAQMEDIRKNQETGILPQVVTVSQGWSGWEDEGTIWKIPPPDFETLLRKAKDFIAKIPPDQLGHRMLLLDNWNEWGEGHFVAPYREYGFGYLDAVRKVFGDGSPREDLIPEDIGMGPYDSAYQSYRKLAEALRYRLTRKIAKPGADEKGLIAWWSFDESNGDPAALDDSGHRMGGELLGAKRVKGIVGNALECAGGCVLAKSDPRFSPANGLTVECWAKTETPGQSDKWLLNRILGSGDSGYRMGLVEGKPCFAIPVTSWSHHLVASDPLPLGRWTLLDGTFDGRTMRIYVNGEEKGAIDRPGPIKANDSPLCLGNYALNHSAHFTGSLDEAKLYDRALTPEEIKSHYAKLASAASSQPGE